MTTISLPPLYALADKNTGKYLVMTVEPDDEGKGLMCELWLPKHNSHPQPTAIWVTASLAMAEKVRKCDDVMKNHEEPVCPYNPEDLIVVSLFAKETKK